jgi:hypothetical protein
MLYRGAWEIRPPGFSGKPVSAGLSSFWFASISASTSSSRYRTVFGATLIRRRRPSSDQRSIVRGSTRKNSAASRVVSSRGSIRGSRDDADVSARDGKTHQASQRSAAFSRSVADSESENYATNGTAGEWSENGFRVEVCISIGEIFDV